MKIKQDDYNLKERDGGLNIKMQIGTWGRKIILR